jgi:hypothetical protein
VDPVTDRQPGQMARPLTADANWLTVLALSSPTGPIRVSRVCSSIWPSRPGWAFARLGVRLWPFPRWGRFGRSDAAADICGVDQPRTDADHAVDGVDGVWRASLLPPALPADPADLDRIGRDRP